MMAVSFFYNESKGEGIMFSRFSFGDKFAACKWNVVVPALYFRPA